MQGAVRGGPQAARAVVGGRWWVRACMAAWGQGAAGRWWEPAARSRSSPGRRELAPMWWPEAPAKRSAQAAAAVPAGARHLTAVAAPPAVQAGKRKRQAAGGTAGAYVQMPSTAVAAPPVVLEASAAPPPLLEVRQCRPSPAPARRGGTGLEGLKDTSNVVHARGRSRELRIGCAAAAWKDVDAGPVTWCQS